MLDHIGQVERHTKCNNNVIQEPAVHNAHLARAAGRPPPPAARPLCLRSKAPNKGTFLVAVRHTKV